MFNEEFSFGHEMGSVNAEQLDSLSKALLAPGSADDLYGTSQTPGGVLTNQSLEGMLANLTLKEQDYTLWHDINKIKAFSTVEEYDQQIGIGINDGGFVGQMENPEFRDPDFQKQVAIVKFMSEGWQVADVQEATNTIVDVRTRQQRAAMGRLLRNLDMALYNGDSSMIPKSIDGISKIISGQTSEQVRDMRGGNLTMNTFNLMGQLITEGNGYVENSKIYVSPAGLQNLSKIIESGAASTGDRKIVEMGQNGITIGGKISNIMTTYGMMVPRMDKVLGLAYESRQVPQYYNQATGTWTEGATSDKAPSVPSIELTNNASTTGSYFAAGIVRPSGVKYNYRVVARNEYGRSIGCASVESTDVVAAGGSVSIAITPNPSDSGSKLPTCFEIYSEKVGGSGTFRYLTTVAAATNPLSAVTYVDKNDYIPGTARMFIVDQTSAGEDRVMAYSQLLPIHNTDLAKTGRFTQGLINLYGVPKYYKPNILVEIRNIGIDQSNSNLFNTV
jgi:hypothetical protein